jgi:glycosyltransferase involved in cell wall biosynthesis
LAQRLGITDNVIFLGQRRDMPGVYASLDIVVLPSLNEGMPMSVLEALAAKRPVIATPIGEIRRVIVHEKTGLLVRPRDVDDLRSAILRLLAEPGFRDHLAAKGRASLERAWSSDIMAEQYESLYHRVFAARAAA